MHTCNELKKKNADVSEESIVLDMQSNSGSGEDNNEKSLAKKRNI